MDEGVTVFATGSKRSSDDGRPRFSLLPPLAMHRLGVLYAVGAKRYGDRNWERGQPFSRVLDSLMRHVVAYLGGDRCRDARQGDDHLASIAWNALALMEFEELIERKVLPASLDDMPRKPPTPANRPETPDDEEPERPNDEEPERPNDDEPVVSPPPSRPTVTMVCRRLDQPESRRGECAEPRVQDGVIYLASPYTHDDPEVREARAIEAEVAAAWLMGFGYRVFCPIAHTHAIGKHIMYATRRRPSTACASHLPLGVGDAEFWRRQDEYWLARCSAIVVVPIEGWRDSAGVRHELGMAKALGMTAWKLAEGKYPRTPDHLADWDAEAPCFVRLQ